MRGRSTFSFMLIILTTALMLVSCKPRLNASLGAVEDSAAVLTANAVDVQTLSAGLQQAQNQQAGTNTSAGTQIGQTANQNKKTPQPLGSPQSISTQQLTQRQPTTYTYKITPAKTSSSLTASLTPTVTITQSGEPFQQTGWAGSWTAYLEQTNGTYLSGPLTVTLSGNSLQGTANLGGTTMTVTSDLADSSNTIYGAYSLGAGNGTFVWLQISDQSFKGNIDNELAFCAARPGGTLPDPCGYFLPS